MTSCSLSYNTQTTKSQNKGDIKTEISLTSKHSEEKMDDIELYCYVSKYDQYTINVSFFSRAKERVFIEWEHARFNNDRIAFGDDNRLTMRNHKADEAISSFSFSLSKDILPVSHIQSDYILPIFKLDKIKSGESSYVFLKIPVRFADGSVEDYKYEIRIYWEEQK